MKKYIILFLTLGIFLAGKALAAPAINSVSGTISDGQSVSIGGSGFGEKATAAPVKWGNFEEGMNNTLLNSNQSNTNGWLISSNGGYAPAYYSDTYIRAGSNMSVCCKSATTENPNNNNSMIGYQWSIPPNPNRFYVTFWRYNHVTNFTALPDNYKSIRGDGNSSGACSFKPAFGFIANPNTYNWYLIAAIHLANPDLIACGKYVYYTSSQYISPQNPGVFEKWIREELYYDGGTQGVANGNMYYNINGQEKASISNKIFLNDSSRVVKIRVGNEWRSGSDLYSYLDDVYIDTTQARVELGNSSTFSACTHREIQPATAWSGGLISFAFNKGSFSYGDMAYLFVVDENGNASSGKQVTIGEGSSGGDTIAPSVPSGLSVK